MKIICKIKAKLNIVSPSGNRYCRINQNPNNKNKCFKCKYFKHSLWVNEVEGRGLVEGLNNGIKNGKKTGNKIKKTVI